MFLPSSIDKCKIPGAHPSAKPIPFTAKLFNLQYMPWAMERMAQSLRMHLHPSGEPALKKSNIQ
jgi:hypothetical protein